MDTFHSIRGQGFSFYARACARAFGEFKTVSILMSVFMLSVCPAFALNASLQHSAANISDTKLEICLPAIAQLGRSHDGEAAAVLELAFGKEHRPVVRRAIANALGLLRSPTSVPEMIEALNDADIQVRQSVVVTLKSIGGDEADQALLNQASREYEASVKAYLIPALEQSRNPKAKNILKTFTQDSDSEISRIARESLSRKMKKEGL